MKSFHDCPSLTIPANNSFVLPFWPFTVTMIIYILFSVSLYMYMGTCIYEVY